MAVVHILLVELGALPQAARAGTASSTIASAALHVRRRDVNPLRMYFLVARAGMHKAQPTVPAVRDPERRKAEQHAYRAACGGLGPGDSFTSTLAYLGRVDPDIVTVTNGSPWRQPHLETADAVFSTAEAPWRAVRSRSLAEPGSAVSGSSTSLYVDTVFAECPSRPLASQSSTACLTVYVADVRNPLAQLVMQRHKLRLHIGLALATYLATDLLSGRAQTLGEPPRATARASLIQPGL